MWSKLLAYFRPSPFKNLEVKSAQTLSIGPNEFLVITVKSSADEAMLRRLEQGAKGFFRTENILVVAGDDVRVLKIAIEDRMAEIMLKEELTKWTN